MKIVIINSLYAPDTRGGAEVIAQAVAEGLVKAGHQVTVIASSSQPGQGQVGLVYVHRIKPFNIFSYQDIVQKSFFLRLPWHLIDMFGSSGAKQVKSILQETQADAVITHNLKGLGFKLPKVIKALKLKHVHILHDVQLVKPSGLMKAGKARLNPLDLIYTKITRRQFGSPAVVISPSKWLMRFYLECGFFKTSQTHILPNPVTLNLAGHKRSLNNLNFNLLYVGQLEKHKGILFLIDALKSLEATNFTLTIVGKGQMHMITKDHIKGDNRFKYLGYVEPSQLADLYKSTDASVVPSLCFENAPAVITQSLAAQVPVIASDIGGVGELIKDGINGYKFEAGNADGLKAILNSMAKDDIDQMNQNCAQYKEQFSVSNYIKKLINYI